MTTTKIMFCYDDMQQLRYECDNLTENIKLISRSACISIFRTNGAYRSQIQNNNNLSHSYQMIYAKPQSMTLKHSTGGNIFVSTLL